MSFQGYTPLEKSHCINRYIELHSVTTVRRKFCTINQRTPATRPSILRWVRNIGLPGNVENRNASGPHLVSQKTIQTVLNYFTAHPRRPPRRAALDLHPSFYDALYSTQENSHVCGQNQASSASTTPELH